MSERGIEIHNGEVVFPEGMPQEFHLGTVASPLTQGEAAQIVVSAVINIIALAGDAHAGQFIVNASVSMAYSGADFLSALHAKAVVNAAVVITGSMRAALIQTEIGAAGQITLYYEGLRVNQSADAAALLDTIYSIHINNYIQCTPTGSYYYMRFSENGGVDVTAAFFLTVPGQGGDMANLFYLSGQCTAWHLTLAAGDEAGRIAVIVGDQQRYLKLYVAPP